VVQLVTGALCLPVLGRYLYFVAYFEVYLSAVSIDIPVFFILDFNYKLLCLLDGLLHAGDHGLSFFLAEVFGVRGQDRDILVEKNTGRITVNYFESRYTDATVF
jgi:hypothetical protein